MTLPTDTCGDSLPPGTPGPGGRDTAFRSTCGPRTVGGTGRPLGKTVFLHCQRRHPELPMTPTYLPTKHSAFLAQLLLEEVDPEAT